MRRSLAGISVAVTALVAVAFLVPLAVLVGEQARDRALAAAFRDAAALAPVLVLTTDPAQVTRALAGGAGRTAVYLPDYPESGRSAVVGPAGAAPADVDRVWRSGRASAVPGPDGTAVLQPVLLDGGRRALVEVDVPAAELSRGVTRARVVLTLLALVLVAGSVAFADRLASRVVRAARALGGAAARIGSGDLDARITPRGPAELRDAAFAFNSMAERLVALVRAEREQAADLSHRLRAPLAGFRLAAPDGPGGAGVREAADRLQAEIDQIIRDARDPRRWAPAHADAASVLRERLVFWGALAEDQRRPWRLAAPDGPVRVPVPAGDLAAALDAVLGNVFVHTPQGSGFEVTLALQAGEARIAVADSGPGIADPARALRRGSSDAGSTGLGLDIARRLAEGTGGGLRLGRSALGGARVELVLGGAGEPAAPGSRRRR